MGKVEGFTVGVWHLGRVRFMGAERRPYITDVRGESVFADRLQLGSDWNGHLVAFQVDDTGTRATDFRLPDAKERTRWESVLERRAARRNKKINRRIDPGKGCEPERLRHALEVAAHDRVKKKGRPEVRSIMLIARGESRKPGSHRDNRGHH